MTSHELAKLLLTLPDLDIATHANNHTCYWSENIRVALMNLYGNRKRILIGNMSKKNLNKPNWYITEMLDGKSDLSDEW